MTNTKIISNQHIQVRIGPDTEIDDWDAPTLADITALEDVSAAINWDGFDFNIEASEQADDRTLTDAAGAQSRQYDQFGGAISFVRPRPDDTTSAYAIARDIVATPRTNLAIAIRTVLPATTAPAAGQTWNVYRVETDAKSEGRGDVSHFYTVNFAARDDLVVEYVVPSASPGTVTLTPSAAITDAEVGDIGFITASVEGRNITIGGTWVSSDPDIVEVTQHGAWIAKAVGGPVSITCDYKSNTVSTAKAITVIDPE